MLDYRYKNLYVKCITIGGIETCYILPQLGIAFDVGRAPRSLINIPTIFLTHGHLDHASGLPYYVGQRALRNLSVPNVYLSKKLKPYLESILQLWGKVEDFQSPCNFHAVDPQQDIWIGDRTYVRVLDSFHRVPSHGYVIFERTIKLKKKYVGLSSAEIVQLKKQGKLIVEEVDIPIFAFSGDTTIEFVLHNPVVLEAKVLFMESTYLDKKRPVERARKWGHTHLDEIIMNQDKFKNEKLVLVHLSQIYSRESVAAVLKQSDIHLRGRLDIIYRSGIYSYV